MIRNQPRPKKAYGVGVTPTILLSAVLVTAPGCSDLQNLTRFETSPVTVDKVSFDVESQYLCFEFSINP
jgi:hypothetical protein